MKLENKDLLDLDENYSLFCPLVTNDFSVETRSKQKYVIKGYTSSKTGSLPFKEEGLYQVEVWFAEQHETGIDFLEKEKIIEILATKSDCIECKILQHIYPYSAYLSESFCIPKDSILKELL